MVSLTDKGRKSLPPMRGLAAQLRGIKMRPGKDGTPSRTVRAGGFHGFCGFPIPLRLVRLALHLIDISPIQVRRRQ